MESWHPVGDGHAEVRWCPACGVPRPFRLVADGPPGALGTRFLLRCDVCLRGGQVGRDAAVLLAAPPLPGTALAGVAPEVGVAQLDVGTARVVAGIAGGVVLLLMGLGMGVLLGRVVGPADDVAADDTFVFELGVGDCLDHTFEEDPVVDEQDAVPCDEPHDIEIVASVALSGSEYPGDEAVSRMADDACLEAFERRLGPYDDSPLEFFAILPDRSAWEAGDREALCLVYDPSGEPLVGPLQPGRV